MEDKCISLACAKRACPRSQIQQLTKWFYIGGLAYKYFNYPFSTSARSIVRCCQLVKSLKGVFSNKYI